MPARLHVSISALLFSFSMVLGVPAPVRAQGSSAAAPDANASIRLRESIVVTATGKEETASRVGASITAIDQEVVEQRHALNLTDLLITVPGVVAVRNGGIGGLTSLYVRGGESTYNKVLLDGMPLNEPGGTFNFANLSPENIERIEVLRGAHSALFGSDAMASVIQIFTKRPDRNRPQASITLDAGTYSTTHVAGSVGAKTDAVEYSAFASRLQTDNRAPNNENRTTTASGSIFGQVSPGALVRFMARTETGRTGTPGPTAFGRADMDAFFRHRDGALSGGWNQTLGSRVTQQGGYAYTLTHQRSTNLKDDPPFTPTYGDLVAAFPSFDYLYDSGTDLHRHHIDYRVDAIVAPNQTLTGAFAYDGERGVLTDFMAGTDPQKPARNNTGTTVQYEAAMSRASIVGGVRFENNGSFGFYAAPRVTVSWVAQPGNDGVGATRIRASAGRGIKEPTFLQSYSPSIYYLGNPDLKPERSRGFDVGISQRLAEDRVNLEATYFANHFDDLISLGPSDPMTFASQYENIGETRASGFELVAAAVTDQGLQLRGSYTLLDSKVIKSTSSSPIFAAGKALYRRPRHSGALQAAFSRSRYGVTLGGIFVGSRVDTDYNFPSVSSSEVYAVWNASGEVRFASRTALFVNLDNLADRDYMDPFGYPALGRAIRAGIRTGF